tara:strand:+ start:315 stop:455 length:141 start_codon:yes stop_codon:yes gene_type:complete
MTEKEILKGIKLMYESDLHKLQHVYSEEQILNMFVKAIKKHIKESN